jgi:uncharacterized protein involved in exopolysaccharide biosynthesis
MHDYLRSNSEDEIDIRELFLTLWAHKILIVCICAIGIFCGVYFALNAGKEFTSTAVFKLDETKNNNIGSLGDSAVLSGLAGLGVRSSSSILPKSKIYGRIFIEKIDTKLDLQADTFFNRYNPKALDPIWKSIIKRTIGWQNTPRNIEETIWQGISNYFSKYVMLEETDDSAIKIIVTHSNADRAAIIANTIMDEIIVSSRQRSESEQEKQTSYLSNTLAEVLFDLESAQSNLKAFAIDNSALPLEKFAEGSFQLEALRAQFKRTTELHDAVEEILQILDKNANNEENYFLLRQKFPIVDQVEFRRVLGQSEIITSWSWPDAKTVLTVFNTLVDRKNRLQTEIEASLITAEQSSQALEEYARLERKENIAEATYLVLIEQVKAQSMAAGYNPKKSEVYEYATPSVNPSAPIRKYVVGLGGLLGLFIGIVITLVYASSRNVFYSKRSLATSTQARLIASNKTLHSLRKKGLKEINKRINKKPKQILGNVIVEINKNATSIAVVTSSRSKIESNDTAQALALSMKSMDYNIAVIDFSNKSSKLYSENIQTSFGSLVVTESEDHVSILKPKSGLEVMDILSGKDFLENIHSLKSDFKLIFLCADNNNAISLLRALEGQKMYHLTLARIKHTKSDTLRIMNLLLPIQGLLHD